MFCGNCGNQMTETEKFCSKCGWRNPLVGSTTPAQPVETATAPVQPAQPVMATPVQSEAPAPVQPVAPGSGNQVPAQKQTSGKKPPMGLLIGIGVAVLAVIFLLVCLLTSATVKNWFKKTFSEPEEYYQWVEGKVAEEVASNVSTIYDDYLRESLKIYDTSVSVEAGVQLEETGMDMLSLLFMGTGDVSWFDSANFAADISIKDNKISVDLQETDLLSVAGILDLAEENAYLQLPDLNEMYMMAETDDAEEVIEYMDMLKVLYEASPDKKLVEKILNRYTELVLSCVDDVDMSEKTIRAEGVSQDCVELEVTIDEKTLADMAEIVLETMKEDEDIKEWIFEAFATVEESDFDMDLDMDAEEFYEELQGAMDDALDEAEDISDYDMELVMTVYVDSKGNICGRSIEQYEQTIEVLMVHDGSEFGYSATYEMYGDKMELVGSGKDSGGKLTGEFEVKYNGMGLVDIAVEKFDTDKLKVGQLQGTFTVAPSSSLINALELSSYASVIGDLSLTIEAESDENSVKLVCSVLEEEEKWGTITLAASKDSGTTVKLPSDKKVVEVEDMDDFEDWYETVDWEGYIKKLVKAEVDDEITDILEDVSEMDVEEIIGYLFGYSAVPEPEEYYYEY